MLQTYKSPNEIRANFNLGEMDNLIKRCQKRNKSIIRPINSTVLIDIYSIYKVWLFMAIEVNYLIECVQYLLIYGPISLIDLTLI